MIAAGISRRGALTAALLLASACGGAPAQPRNANEDAPDATGVTCDYRRYLELAAEVRAIAARQSGDAELRLLDELDAAARSASRLLELDRIRVACGVEVPDALWSRALLRRVAAADAQITAQLEDRFPRVDPTELHTLEGALLDEDARSAARAALDAVHDALHLALAQRRDVLASVAPDACAVERAEEAAAWSELARALLAPRFGPPQRAAGSEAEAIAIALTGEPTEARAVFARAAVLPDLLGDAFAARRRRALALLHRCPAPLAPALLPP